MASITSFFPNSIIETDGITASATITEAIPVPIENVTRSTVSVHLPDDLVIQAHDEDRVVSEDVPVHCIEVTGFRILTSSLNVHKLGCI